MAGPAKLHLLWTRGRPPFFKGSLVISTRGTLCALAFVFLSWCGYLNVATPNSVRRDFYPPLPLSMDEFQSFVDGLAAEANGSKDAMAEKLQSLGFTCTPYLLPSSSVASDLVAVKGAASVVSNGLQLIGRERVQRCCDQLLVRCWLYCREPRRGSPKELSFPAWFRQTCRWSLSGPSPPVALGRRHEHDGHRPGAASRTAETAGDHRQREVPAARRHQRQHVEIVAPDALANRLHAVAVAVCAPRL